MNWAKSNESSRTLLYSVAVIGAVAIALLFGTRSNSSVVQANNANLHAAVPTATFAANAASLGAIPDHASGCDATGAAPRNVTFTVSGLSGSVATVDATVTFGSPAHSWVGDIEAVLIAPNGASHTLFGRTGETTATGCGDSSDLTGPYTFSDSAGSPPNGGWWQTATLVGTAAPMTPGSYRSTNIGGVGATNPQPPTSINPSFTGVTDANGTWTLRVSDHGGGDTGAVSAATLSITTSAPTVPADANLDVNGDGKTDYVVARGTNTPLADGAVDGLVSVAPFDREVRRTPGAKRPIGKGAEDAIAPPIFWYVSLNGSGTTGVAQLGDAATDFLTPEDFDGDGKDDLTVWTDAPATQANFKIFQSTTNTVRVEFFGQTGDDPAVVGDYDGDGKADPAVYRCPAITDPDGQCFFFFRGSNNNPSGNITYVPWGFGVDGDFFPLIGDFDGDSKNDFCIQRANPSSPANGQFVLLRSQDLGVEYINWGLSSDFLIPGDYDGDGKWDFCVRRTVGGVRQHWVLFRTGSTGFVNWGITGDSSVPGDYDGDGKTDFAIWRGNADPTQNYFWVLNSSNLAVSQFEWGQCPSVSTCDFPVAGWAVH